jgi:hypothetical protein
VPDEALRDPAVIVHARLVVIGDALARAIEGRVRDRTSGLEKLLTERRDKEVADIRKILEDLQRLIAGKIAEPGPQQLTFGFEGWTDPEREQLERNMDALRARLREIPAEIERETAAAAARFSNLQPRLFPVAVTFLVPRRLA